MFINKYPKTGSKNGAVRYYASFYLGEVELYKVRCQRSWYDKENNSHPVTCEVLGYYITSKKESSSDNMIVDNIWQLQETLQDAIKLMIILIFHRDKSASYNLDPPWE